MNILLVSPSNKIRSDFHNWTAPHSGIWRLAGWLGKHGHPVQVWDQVLDPEIPDNLDEYDIIGFSLFHNTLPYDVELMRLVARKAPGAEIVAGGMEASNNYQRCLESVPALSRVCIGEGEDFLLDMADGHSIKNLPAGGIGRAYRELSRKRFVDYCFAMPFSKMRHGEHWKITRRMRPGVPDRNLYCVRVSTSTFCEKNCRFCSATHIHRQAAGHACKPIALTGEENQELVRKIVKEIPLTQTVYFSNDSFTTYPDEAARFFDDPPGGLDYHIESRVDQVDGPLLKHMERGRLKRITLGVENFSDRLLHQMGKGTTVEQSEAAIRAALDAGLVPLVLCILFPPTASVEDLLINLEKFKYWTGQGAVVSFMTAIVPYAGTWYTREGLHDIQYVTLRGMKMARAVMPDDPKVREIWREYDKRNIAKELTYSHASKDTISGSMIGLLEEVYKEKGIL